MKKDTNGIAKHNIFKIIGVYHKKKGSQYNNKFLQCSCEFHKDYNIVLPHCVLLYVEFVKMISYINNIIHTTS